MNYYLHRISHESEVSMLLWNHDYLSIGWKKYREAGRELIAAVNPYTQFKSYIDNRYGDWARSVWGLWRFLSFSPGDKVVVPLRGKSFAVVKISEDPIPAAECPFFDERIASCDIGFVVKIEKLWEGPRENAHAKLQARMKIRSMNAEINDLHEQVEEAQITSTPIWARLHETLSDSVVNEFLQTLCSSVTPDQLEHIVKWYMRKNGAKAEVQAKNEPGKEDGADSDVVADFENLHIRIYIQIKKHHKDTETGKWAIEQISRYAEQKQEIDLPSRDYVCCFWVISTARFSEEAQKLANKTKVRLIDGEEFAKMLIDCGIEDISEAF